MNVTYQGILVLLRSAITGEKLTLPEGFDLAAAYGVIRRHQLVPLAYEGAVNCGIHNSPVFRSILQESCQHLLASERQAGLVRSICRTFPAHPC